MHLRCVRHTAYTAFAAASRQIAGKPAPTPFGQKREVSISKLAQEQGLFGYFFVVRLSALTKVIRCKSGTYISAATNNGTSLKNQRHPSINHP
jgi:hypothetical protein